MNVLHYAELKISKDTICSINEKIIVEMKKAMRSASD